jgi:acyl-CoA-dependent ceramide synthase
MLQLLEYAVNSVKGFIEKTFSLTPYKGYVEKSLYLVVEHTVFFIGGMLTFWNRDWLYDISMMWDYEFELSVYVYYYLYFARYVIQITQMDKKDKDYNVLLTHHLMTLALLGASLYRYTRVGVIIALSHDLADIFLNLAKATNKIYEIGKDKRFETISNTSLGLFVTSWVPTRIILNYNILHEIYTHKSQGLELYLDEKICIALLLLNFCLQVFWQVMIIKFAYNIFVGSPPVDEKGVKYKI